MTPEERAREDAIKAYERGTTGTSAPNLWIEEVHNDVTVGYCIADIPAYETFTSDRGRLYKSLVGTYGRCVGAMHFESEGGRTVPNIGWVFQKRRRYEDTGRGTGRKAVYYIHEVWVTLVHRATVTRKIETYVPVGVVEEYE